MSRVESVEAMTIVYRRRMRLRRADGAIYLDRWGIQVPAIGGVFLHRMDAPDPGVDLHDHPWTFVTVPLVGSYTEERALCREAPQFARIADHFASETCKRGVEEDVRRWRPRLMRLDECHRITRLSRRRVWTLVFVGPVRRKWGFYLAGGYMDERTYDAEVRPERRDLWNEHPDDFELQGREK